MQSTVVGTRDELDSRFAEIEEQYSGVTVPRPANWGGWRIAPQTVEFWQGQPNRFHDRIRYVREGENWRKERLAP
jgi:pyridoxamine 5'-phosphate oxidase